RNFSIAWPTESFVVSAMAFLSTWEPEPRAGRSSHQIVELGNGCRFDIAPGSDWSGRLQNLSARSPRPRHIGLSSWTKVQLLAARQDRNFRSFSVWSLLPGYHDQSRP